MAEDQKPPMPQGPAGVQRQGVPGAGNILDPEVRGQIRETLHPVVHDAVRQARGEPETKDAAASAEIPQPAAEKPAAPAAKHRAGPYPHGDVDLSFIAANVPREPVRPRRGRAARRFYFLPEAAPGERGPEAPPAPAGPKPG